MINLCDGGFFCAAAGVAVVLGLLLGRFLYLRQQVEDGLDCVARELEEFQRHRNCRCEFDPLEVAGADYVSRLEAFRVKGLRLKNLRTDLLSMPHTPKPEGNLTVMLGREFDEKVARAGTFSFPVLNVPGPGYDIRVPLGRSYHKKRGGGWALCELPRCPICEGGSMATYSSAPTAAELAKRGKAKP